MAYVAPTLDSVTEEDRAAWLADLTDDEIPGDTLEVAYDMGRSAGRARLRDHGTPDVIRNIADQATRFVLADRYYEGYWDGADEIDDES